VPVIDFQQYIGQDENSQSVKDMCQLVAESFHKYGILIVRDPRAKEEENDEYIDIMEKYFDSRGKIYYAGEKLEEEKPECHFLVGVTPEGQEHARPHEARIKAYDDANRPMSPLEPVPDAKWRFLWKIGERLPGASDNFDQVIPPDFPDWEEKMDRWGNKLLAAVQVVAEMAAIGMGIEKDAFTKRMVGGSQLLAPTGSDLHKHGVGTVLAGYHYDIAFLTIHGKSRYPGLYVWTRENQKL